MAENVRQAALSISFQNKSIGEKVKRFDKDLEVDPRSHETLPLSRKLIQRNRN